MITGFNVTECIIGEYLLYRLDKNKNNSKVIIACRDVDF
jgi:hypothetical protein